MSEIHEAYNIAKHDLQSCYAEDGIKTGALRDTYWSWDSFFASFGAIELGEFEIVKKNFKLYFKHQKPNGLLPRRISSSFLSYQLGMISPVFQTRGKKPSYRASFFSNPSKLQNLIAIISTGYYIEKTRDTDFLKNNYSLLKKALNYLLSFIDEEGYLIEGVFENWSESVLKKGKVFLSQTLLYMSYKALEKMARLSKDPFEKELGRRAKKLKQNLQQTFWTGTHFLDWIDNIKHTHFSVDGNLFAIISGLADSHQSALIQKQIRLLQDSVPLPTNVPKYPLKNIFFLNWIINKDYHNGWSWLWLGCVDCVAKHTMGMYNEAQEQLASIAQIIVRDKAVFEIYADKKPLKNWIYTAESQFAWSAGLFIWAYHSLGMNKQN